MRLTGGEMRGRKVKAKGLGTETAHGALRATSSKVREALFNILAPEIDGAVFADLYSGSGTVGMEAMSRGAAKVYFVEADRGRAMNLAQTLEGCGCRAKAEIRTQAVEAFIAHEARSGEGMDIVFMDPPYRTDEYERVLEALGKGDALAGEATVVVEHERARAMPERAGVLVKRKEYRYGGTTLTLYRREP